MLVNILFKVTRLIILPAFLLIAGKGWTQVTITGVQCVATTVDYQYEIKAQWKEGDKFRVCVEGGVLVESGNNCIENNFVSSVRVHWAEGNNAGKITVSSTSGTGSLDVTISKPFSPGSIQSKERQVLASNRVPAAITCSAAQGGNCSPVFVYQWEQSSDRQQWMPVNGGNQQNLKFSKPVTGTIYVRRKVTESKSRTIAYSDIIEVTVIHPAGKPFKL